MPVRIFIFLAKKPGTTAEFFKNYMESKHIPLIQSISGGQFPFSHTRYYITHPTSETDIAVPAGLNPDIIFDAMTEAVFRDEAHFTAHLDLLNQPENKVAREKDEVEFLDCRVTRYVRIGEACRIETQ